MFSGVNFPEIYIANGMGLMLAILMLTSSRWKVSASRQEQSLLRIMVICVIISCLCDPVDFTVNGMSGTAAYLANYIANFWLYFAVIILGFAWIGLISIHLGGTFGRKQLIFCTAVSALGLLLLILNFFFPLVFTISRADNVYTRGPFFWVYTAIQFLFMGYGIVIFLRAHAKGGQLKFFPVLQFILPALLGTVVQGAFYGISLIWPCISVGLAGLVISLHTEAVFRDRLTGLFSRFYMDNIYDEIRSSRKSVIAVMMLDLNNFKSINDTHGHSTGDEALKAAASLMRKAVGTSGCVIRYAGDEFVILLNTDTEKAAEACIENIHGLFQEYTVRSGKPYVLSASIGYSVANLKERTMDDILHEVDKKMYASKQKYYDEHPQYSRRCVL